MRLLFTVLVVGLLPLSHLHAKELTNQRLIPETGEEYGAMALSADGRSLFTAGSGAQIKEQDFASAQTVRAFDEPDGYTFALATSPDGRLIASAGGAISGQPGIVRLRDLHTGEVRTIREGYEKPIRCLAFTPDSATLVTGGDDHTIQAWNVATGELTGSLNHMGYWFALSRDGKLLATIGEGHSVEVRAFPSDEKIASLRGHGSRVQSLAFSPDGTRLASGGDWGDTAIRVWDPRSGTLVATLAGVDDPVQSIAFSPSGDRLAAAKLNGAVELWDPESGRLLEKHSGGIAGSVAFTPDGKTLAQVFGMSDAGSGVYLRDVAGE